MLLGFDIGGTKCAVVLGDQPDNAGHSDDMDIRIVDKLLLGTDRPVYDMIELLFANAESLLFKHGLNKEELNGIGISCGGPLNSSRGVILSPPNLPGWDNIPIVEITKKRFGVQATLQNDANACAIAEWKYGAGRGYSNLVFLTFGTGMGAGLILDGKLYSGTTDLAGEVGHLRLADMGPVGFGKAGSFEGYCSGGGIAQLAQIKTREKLQMGGAVSFCKSMEDLPFITAKTVAEAAYRGDSLAADIYRICAEYLGRGLSLIIDMLNPEIIIIGSIFGRAKDLLEPHMNRILRAEALSDSVEACQVVPAGLAEHLGDMAALSLAAISAQSKNLNEQQHKSYKKKD